MHRLICASNSNKVLFDFFRTGTYDRNREFILTSSPSMDILISRNLERLLYHMTDDASAVRKWMRELQQKGSYTIPADLLQKIQQTFWADWEDDAATKHMIEEAYTDQGYVPDTHTAVAWKAAENYRETTGDDRCMVVVSTASPYKFNQSVLSALHVSTEGLDEFGLLDALQEKNNDPVPQGLASLRKKEIRHTDVCDKDHMPEAVFAFAVKK